MTDNSLRDLTRDHTNTLPHYDAMDLTRGGDLAEITLHDQVYRLRVTKAGKLILTK